MKKFLAMLLALIMVLSMAACGAKTETPAPATTPAAPAEPSNEEKLLAEIRDLLKEK